MGKIKVFIVALLTMLVISTGVYAETSMANTNNVDDISAIQPRYSYTDRVTAELSFSNGKANCYGSVAPSGSYDASIIVALYKKNGTKWDYITSWRGSATGGHTAAAKGSFSVSHGTYKVIATGNVAGLEFPTVDIEKTY